MVNDAVVLIVGVMDGDDERVGVNDRVGDTDGVREMVGDTDGVSEMVGVTEAVNDVDGDTDCPLQGGKHHGCRVYEQSWKQLPLKT